MKKKLTLIFVLMLVVALAVVFTACGNKGEKLQVPEYVTPTLGAAYGQTLGDIALPEGFSWEEDPSTSVGEVGEHEFHLTYTPEDTSKFRTVTGIAVTVTVTKGEPAHSTVATLNATYGQTLGDVQLPAGFSWQDPATTPVGNAGRNIFNVVFTPTDTEHYNVVRNIPVTVVVAKATYDMRGVTFADLTLVYDGQEHSIVVSGTLPQGVSVSYEHNTLTEVGHVEAIAHFAVDANHNAIDDMHATLTITSAGGGEQGGQGGETPGGGEQGGQGGEQGGQGGEQGGQGGEQGGQGGEQGGETPQPQLQDPDFETPEPRAVYRQDLILGDVELPEGFSWEEVLSTSIARAGEYEFHVTYTPADTVHYNIVSNIPVSLRVDKATYDMTGITFDDIEVVYDGQPHTAVLSGQLPVGVSVQYDNNTKTDVVDGAVATVYFIVDENHNDINYMTATITINKADIDWIVFDDGSAVYDGQEHGLVIAGELPAGITVEYLYDGAPANGMVNAGEYTVTARFMGENTNYNILLDKEATLTIGKALPDISALVPELTVIAINDAEHYFFGEWCLAIGFNPERPGGVAVTPSMGMNINYADYARVSEDSANYLPIDDVAFRVLGWDSSLYTIMGDEALTIYDSVKDVTIRLVDPSGGPYNFVDFVDSINAGDVFAYIYAGDVTDFSDAPIAVYNTRFENGYILLYEYTRDWHENSLTCELKYILTYEVSTLALSFFDMGEVQYLYHPNEFCNETISFNDNGLVFVYNG